MLIGYYVDNAMDSHCCGEFFGFPSSVVVSFFARFMDLGVRGKISVPSFQLTYRLWLLSQLYPKTTWLDPSSCHEPSL